MDGWITINGLSMGRMKCAARNVSVTIADDAPSKQRFADIEVTIDTTETQLYHALTGKSPFKITDSTKLALVRAFAKDVLEYCGGNVRIAMRQVLKLAGDE